MGGSSGGGSKVVQLPPQSTTSTSAPWGPQQDYLKTGFRWAEDAFLNNRPKVYPGQRVAGFAPESEGAMQMITDRAVNGSPIVADANNYTSRVLNDDYLYGGSGFNAAVDAALRKIRPQVDSSFALSGQTHGSGLLDVAMGQAASDAFASLYNSERDRQNQMATFAPTLAREDFNDAAQLWNVGQARQQQQQSEINSAMSQYSEYDDKLRQQIADYMGVISGNYGGSTSGTTSGLSQIIQQASSGNPVLNAFNGATAGLGVGTALGVPWLGAAAGLTAGLF